MISEVFDYPVCWNWRITWPGQKSLAPKFERKALRYQSDLTDAEWALLAPHLSGQPRKWSWPDDVKVRIVLESFEAGARVSEVSRRNGLTPQHLSTWRGMARKGKLRVAILGDEFPTFAALELETDEAVVVLPTAGIEIDADGVTVRLSLDMPAFRRWQVRLAQDQ